MVSTKADTYTIFQRCSALLRRLQRGPVTKVDWIASLQHAPEGDLYEGATGRALQKRFEADKARLKDIFGVTWVYHQASGEYELQDIGAPVIDLPDEALKAMAFLQSTFEPGAPMADAVQNLLSLLVNCLPPERGGVVSRQRAAFSIEWGQRDDDVIDLGVEAKLQRALQKRRLVALDYYSPSQADGQPRRHTVEPWGLAFSSVWGHYYLRGYCRHTESAAYGRVMQRKYMYYRLGRIRNVEVLPEKLSPIPPTVHPKPLAYRLAATIARQGDVTRHPGITIVRKEAQEDGSLIVHAEVDNVWWAVRSLLHYGANCEVLGGREVLWEMRKTVRAMAVMYEEAALSEDGLVQT